LYPKELDICRQKNDPNIRWLFRSFFVANIRKQYDDGGGMCEIIENSIVE